MAEFDFTQVIGEAHAKYGSIAKALGVDRLKTNIKDLETQAAAPGPWDDPENAQKITSRLPAVEPQLKRLNSASQCINDAGTLVELGHEEGDQDSLDETQGEIGEIQRNLDQTKIQTPLNGKYDERPAVVTIHSGAGDVDTADFAQILLRTCLRYCKRNGFKAKIMGTFYAEEAGIRSTTFQVDVLYAYGRLPVEGGTHHLVRIPPFDNQDRHQTSFAAVGVMPLVEATDYINIPDTDTHVDTYCSSNPGGQDMNTTHSTVRITHPPTGIVVTTQDECLQIQSHTSTMAVLRSRLFVLHHEEKARKKRELVGDIKASQDNQIRSYVLHPYQMVKDLYTGHEASQTQVMFDGDISVFVRAGVRWRHEQRRTTKTEE